jgi:hypothetical protein
MTTTGRQEQLEAVERELARQDEEWARAKEALVRLGDVSIVVPASVIEQLQVQARKPDAARVFGGLRV